MAMTWLHILFIFFLLSFKEPPKKAGERALCPAAKEPESVHGQGTHDKEKGLYRPGLRMRTDRGLDIPGLREELLKYRGKYVRVYVMAAIRNMECFPGFLLKLGDDYIELLCITYRQHQGRVLPYFYIADIPMTMLAAISHRI